MDKRIYLCLAHRSGKEQAFIKEAFDTNWVVPVSYTHLDVYKRQALNAIPQKEAVSDASVLFARISN